MILSKARRLISVHSSFNFEPSALNLELATGDQSPVTSNCSPLADR
jgi:hypothetical protein